MAFNFTAVDPTYKVPRFLAQLVFAAGAVGAGSLPLYCLHVGMKTSAGSMVVDQDVVEVTSAEEINAYAGARSQLAQMARAAMIAAPTVRHFIAAVADPTGSYAQCTLTLGGSIATSGSIAITLAGKRFEIGIDATNTLDEIGDLLASRLTSDTELPATFTYDSGTNVLTGVIVNKGAQGKDWIIGVDKSKMPSAMTAALAGSSSLTGDRVKFGVSSSGVGVEDVTTILTKLLTTRYARIAAAQNDATNAALWETHINSKAAATKLLLETIDFAANGSQAAATSVAQTTLNTPPAQFMWQKNSMTHPAVIASVKAAIRAQTEGTIWVPNYDGMTLPGIPPQHASDIHTDTENNTALQNGVTPLTSVNGETKVVRSITTYCLNGSAQDERCLDIGDIVCAHNVTLGLQLLWSTDFLPNNPLVGADPAEGGKTPPEGVAYPRLWNAAAMKLMREYFASGWVEDPDVTPIVSQFNRTSKRIESIVPIVARRAQHQLAIIARQQVSAA